MTLIKPYVAQCNIYKWHPLKCILYCPINIHHCKWCILIVISKGSSHCCKFIVSCTKENSKQYTIAHDKVSALCRSLLSECQSTTKSSVENIKFVQTVRESYKSTNCVICSHLVITPVNRENIILGPSILITQDAVKQNTSTSFMRARRILTANQSIVVSNP